MARRKFSRVRRTLALARALRNSCHSDGNKGIGRLRLAKVTIAPCVFVSSRHVRSCYRKDRKMVVNLRLSSWGKNGRFDRPVLIRLWTRSILSVIYIYIDTICLDHNCFLWVGKGCLWLRPSNRKIHQPASRAGTNNNYAIVVPLASTVERRRNTCTPLVPSSRLAINLFNARNVLAWKIFSLRVLFFSFFIAIANSLGRHLLLFSSRLLPNNFFTVAKYSKIVPPLFIHILVSV